MALAGFHKFGIDHATMKNSYDHKETQISFWLSAVCLHITEGKVFLGRTDKKFIKQKKLHICQNHNMVAGFL